MELNEYQELAGSTAVYPNRGSNLIYTLLGLAGETGELSEKVADDIDLFMATTGYIRIDAIREILTDVAWQADYAEREKKFIRDSKPELTQELLDQICEYNGTITPEFHDQLCKELGDVLWYVSQAAFELGVTLEQIARWNVNKLKSRQERSQLHGQGDNR